MTCAVPLGVRDLPAGGAPIEETHWHRIYACDVSGSIDDPLVLTGTRVTRELTPKERATCLGESP